MQKKSDIKSKTRPNKLNNLLPNEIKEKSYVARKVESSIALLESPEDDIVLEALLYLSKYADIHINNLNYLQQRGLMQKLLNLLNRNICILRLSLRLLGVLLTVPDVLVEIDQDMYDDRILKISAMYVTHSDAYVREFCISILSKLATSCRITCLVFRIDLFNPILDTIQNTSDLVLLEWTLELFLKLLNAPAALSTLPEVFNFDMSILLLHLENEEKKVAHLSFEVINRLTFYCLEVFQKMFREAKLVETMLDVIMDQSKHEFHKIAFDIITNCMKSEETSNYFIESLQFLKFCQWVKSCDHEYLYPSIDILEQLTKIPNRKQMLFDLSVEDSILNFLRSTDKNVLNKTCEAISNMTTHKYCCEKMLTPVVLRELFHILIRKVEEESGNEEALKTILDFSRRNTATLDMIHALGYHRILLNYFKKGVGFVSEQSFLGILEIMYKMSIHPVQQNDIVNLSFFEKLLQLFQRGPDDTATFVCEMLTNFVGIAEFRRNFLKLNGPQIFVGALQTSTNMKLLKNVFVFIHSSLIYDDTVRSFLQNNLAIVLKEYSLHMKLKAPIIEKILSLVYNLHLPLKFFEVNKIDITDKLGNMFYLINGDWKVKFPFLEILEATQVSTIYTLYIVDYRYEVVKPGEDESLMSESISELKFSERTVSTMSQFSPSASSYFRRSLLQITYGKLSSDPYLPRYIYHISRELSLTDVMEEKITILAEYIDDLLCGPKENYYSPIEKIHDFQIHIASLKHKLGTNMIPIGFLRLGFHCERALYFKAIADRCCIPTSLVKGSTKLYWNEVALFNSKNTLQFFVVDLMNNIGNLLMVGSRDANQYCNLKT